MLSGDQISSQRGSIYCVRNGILIDMLIYFWLNVQHIWLKWLCSTNVPNTRKQAYTLTYIDLLLEGLCMWWIRTYTVSCYWL